MKQSYVKAGMDSMSKAMAIIGFITGTVLLLYGIANFEWVIAGISLLCFGFSFKVMHSYKSTEKFFGSVQEQVHSEILSDRRFSNSPLSIEESKKRTHIKAIVKYGPLFVILALFLMWTAVPSFKMVLKYIPAKIVMPKGTF